MSATLTGAECDIIQSVVDDRIRGGGHKNTDLPLILFSGRQDGDPTFRVFLGSSKDLIQNFHGVAPIAEPDGDQVGHPLAKLVDIKGQR